jgi:hypothetical protein
MKFLPKYSKKVFKNDPKISILGPKTALKA